MAKINYVEQMEHSECGLACLSMIMSYYNKHVSLAKIREVFGVPRGGVSFEQLIEIGNEYSLIGKGLKASSQSLLEIKVPVIAHWEGKHFVVVEKMNKKKVTILDPAKGRIKITFNEFEDKYTGYCLLFEPSKSFEEMKKPSYIAFFLTFAFENKKWIFAILIVSLFLQLFGLAVPFVTKWMTDSIIIKRAEEQLSSIGLGLLIAFVLYKAFSISRGFFIARLQTQIDNNMMSKFIAHLFSLPYTFFQNRSAGELLFRANSHVMIRQILSNRLITFIIDGILLFTYAALLLKYSLIMGVVVISLGLFIFAVLILCTKLTQRLTNKEVNAQAKVQSYLSENIHGVCDVKMMGIERTVFSNWSYLFKEQLHAAEKKSIWTSVLNTISSTTQFILPIFLLWYGSSMVISGEMTLGTLLGFNGLAAIFMIPIVSIGTGYTELLYLSSYLQRIYDVFQTEPEQKDLEPVKETISTIEGEISFKNVSFRYDRLSPSVLHNINLTIHPGEKVAIVGASGSGKSTIAKLIMGLYKPSTGVVYLDKVPIQSYALENIRNKIGAVLQETRLFNKTIAQNILLRESGEISIQDYEKIVSSAKAANIHDEIMRTPVSYQTMISESGKNFSGGQRQRLLIARALVNTPNVLILDEATSSLDMISEKKIEQSLSTVNCTQVIIAHRLSTIKGVDRILVLDKGEIVEEGTHQFLLQKKGIYHSLYTAQTEKRNEQISM